jgi:hypothetical protein
MLADNDMVSLRVSGALTLSKWEAEDALKKPQPYRGALQIGSRNLAHWLEGSFERTEVACLRTCR